MLEIKDQLKKRMTGKQEGAQEAIWPPTKHLTTLDCIIEG